MQCHLEAEELNLLADILLEHAERPQCNTLLDKVLARDLRFDSEEFDLAAELLAMKRRDMRLQLRNADAAQQAKLQPMLARLERVLEKIDEACAMF